MLKNRGFSLFELLVVIAIMGAVVGLSSPYAARLYETMQFRSAVRDLITGLELARYTAISSGRAADFKADMDQHTLLSGEKRFILPESVQLSGTTAAELNSEQGKIAVIRFFPDGSSSGGSFKLLHTNGRTVIVRVDWLLGRVTQQVAENE